MILSVVNKPVLYISKPVERIDLMLNVLITKKGGVGREKTLRGNVYGIVYDIFISVYLPSNSSRRRH